MQIAIVQFPGSNCERETTMAVKRACMEPVEFLWNEPVEKLNAMDGFIIIGGFSYEDRSRAGVIASLDPVMTAIKQQAALGKPVLGICNGAQILVESGLVPGLPNHKLAMALTENKRVSDGKILGTGYYNAWINMRVSDDFQRNAFTKFLKPNNILNVPIAHGEGRFIIPPALLDEMKKQGMHVFQYCDEAGKIDDHFPVNPNGSVANIAAVSNKAGNVMAMMPHPERTMNGDAIFKSMRDYILSQKIQQTDPMHYYPRPEKHASYQRAEGAYESLVELVITDNEAHSVKAMLNALGFEVDIKRYAHWEVACDDAETYQKIMVSGVLFNDRKEKLSKIDVTHAIGSVLVRPKEDWVGQQKQQSLQDHFGLKGLHSIRHGVLWLVKVKAGGDADLMQEVINTHIFANPYAHNIYLYT